MRSAAEIRTNMQLLSNSESILSFLYQTKDSDFNEVVVLINPFPEKHTISIPEGKWMILADHLHSGNYSKRVVAGGKVTIEPVCLNVLAKK
jgi:pullulanase